MVSSSIVNQVSPSPTSKNLSASSVSSRVTNGHLRNSETDNPMRRSFTGTPFSKPSSIVANPRATGGGGFHHNTPVTSPSDYLRSSSLGRENIVVSFHSQDDKENSKDHNPNPARIKSPTATKATKNFMSPTISAASKVNPSPRKKILADRSESICTSVSLSEVKGSDRNESIPSSVWLSEVKGSLLQESDLKPVKSNSQKREVSFDTKVTYIENEETAKSDEGSEDPTIEDFTGLLTESVIRDKDCVNLDPSFELSPRICSSVVSPALAPLDDDPSVRPYDPKTNFLSPRPQFLHYKPNPKVDLYKDGKHLEEALGFECSSDTEVDEGETQSDESQKESEDASSSLVTKEELEEIKQETIVSDSNSDETLEMVAKVKTIPKPQSATRRGFIGFLLVLAIAFVWVSVTNSPVMEPAMFNDISSLSPNVPAEISDFMRSSFKDLVQKFQLWFHGTHSRISSMIISFIDQPKTSSYANLSNFLEDSLADGYVINHFILGADNSVDKNAEAAIGDEEHCIKPLQDEEEILGEYDDSLEELVENENVQGFPEENLEHDNLEIPMEVEIPGPDESVVALQSEVMEPVVAAYCTLVDEVPEYEELTMTPQLGVVESVEAEAERMQGVAYDDPESEGSLNEQAVLILETASYAYPEVLESETEQGVLELESNILPEVTSQSLVVSCFSIDNLESSELMGMPLLASSLLVLGVFFIYKKATAKTIRKETKIPGRSTKNCPTEVDMVDEPCPSETSSSFYSKKRLKGSSKAQSQDRRPTSHHRRESLDSSDYSISPSYGSFTTYEKIPIKHGHGDQDDMITPVRRSSRIRNQVISP